MVTILLADQHALVREGLRHLLEDCSDLKVVGEASDGHDCVRLVQQLRPHVVVMDLAMPGLDGIEPTRQIVSERLGSHVLILTMHAIKAYAGYLLQAGAKGLVGKEASSQEVIQAIRKVAAGGCYLPSGLAEAVTRCYTRRGTTEPSPLNVLSARELQVLTRLARGSTSRIIAQELYMSAKAIEYYRARLRAKLQLQTTTDLVRFALRHRVIGDAS